jgi:hypothetical protein
MMRVLRLNYRANSSRNAIIRANSPVASERANPRIAYWNSCGRRAGFRDVPVISPENTIPIPTPAPASPIVASPAPTNFAACSRLSIFVKYFVSSL